MGKDLEGGTSYVYQGTTLVLGSGSEESMRNQNLDSVRNPPEVGELVTSCIPV